MYSVSRYMMTMAESRSILIDESKVIIKTLLLDLMISINNSELYRVKIPYR